MIGDGPEVIVVLLAPSDRELAGASVEEVGRLRRELGPHGTVEVFDRALDRPLEQGPYTVVVKALGAAERLVQAVTGMHERLGGAVAEAEVLAGRDRTVIDHPASESAVTLFYAMYGVEGCSYERFAGHWADEHAALVHHNPFVRRYHQLHADLERTRRAVEAAGLGTGQVFGVAECDFDSVESFEAMASSAVIEAEAADILSISDVARNDGILARRRT